MSHSPHDRGRELWVFGAGVLVGAFAVAGAMRILRTPAHPNSGVASDTVTTGKTSTSPTQWEVPLFDMVDMQPAVRERLQQTRARVLQVPTSPEGWGLLGAVCHAHNLTECAEVCYQRARELDAGDFRFAYMLAILLDSLGREPDGCIAAYRSAARLRPEYPQTYQRIGDALVAQGRIEEAREAYRQAVSVAPDFFAAHRSLGQTALSQGEPVVAVAHLERAVTLMPDDGIGHAELARAYGNVGNRERSEQATARARTLQRRFGFPDPLVDEMRSMSMSSPSCYNRAKRLVEAGKHAAAIPELEIVEAARPDDPLVQVLLSSAYRATEKASLAEKHLARAKQCLTKIARLDPDSVSALMQYGFIQMQQGRISEAISCFRRVQEYMPDDPEVNVELAFALARNREFDEAIEAFECASAGAALGAKAELTWGFLLRRTGAAADSLGHLRSALRLEPENAEAHFHLGAALEQLGRVDEARNHYRRAAEIDPSHRAAQEVTSPSMKRQSDTRGD